MGEGGGDVNVCPEVWGKLFFQNACQDGLRQKVLQSACTTKSWSRFQVQVSGRLVWGPSWTSYQLCESDDPGCKRCRQVFSLVYCRKYFVSVFGIYGCNHYARTHRATQGYSATSKLNILKTVIQTPLLRTTSPLSAQCASTVIVFMDLSVPGMESWLKTLKV